MSMQEATLTNKIITIDDIPRHALFNFLIDVIGYGDDDLLDLSVFDMTEYLLDSGYTAEDVSEYYN